METMLNNFINGNLADAKQQAKRFSLEKIAWDLSYSYGYSQQKAFMTARYLKGMGTFQAARDTK